MKLAKFSDLTIHPMILVYPPSMEKHTSLTRITEYTEVEFSPRDADEIAADARKHLDEKRGRLQRDRERLDEEIAKLETETV